MCLHVGAVEGECITFQAWFIACKINYHLYYKFWRKNNILLNKIISWPLSNSLQYVAYINNFVWSPHIKITPTLTSVWHKSSSFLVPCVSVIYKNLLRTQTCSPSASHKCCPSGVTFNACTNCLKQNTTWLMHFPSSSRSKIEIKDLLEPQHPECLVSSAHHCTVSEYALRGCNILKQQTLGITVYVLVCCYYEIWVPFHILRAPFSVQSIPI